MTGSALRRHPALLTAGFRPLFAVAALWAIVVMLRTVLVFTGSAAFPAMGLLRWHGHEMLFGFLPAVIAGFLLTAVPNWTASRPVSGWPLGALVLLWMLARVALWNAAPNAVTAAIDLAFLPAVAITAARPLAARGRARHWLPVGVALAFTATHALWYASVLFGWRAAEARALFCATMLAALLIAVIGGRIVPAFTRNRLVAAGSPVLPRAASRVDTVALALSAAVALAELVTPAGAAALALAAAPAHALRLRGWRGVRVWNDPLLLVLHIGYAWLALGYAVRACALLGPAWSGPWSLHGILVGAIGTMTLAVMSRATLGHTGRALRAGVVLSTAFVCVQVAAVARLVAPWMGPAVWSVAGGAWVLAYALYLAACGRALVTPRRSSDAGSNGAPSMPAVRAR